jgi:hypothetical protein
MTIDRLFKVRKAMRDERSKIYVQYKFNLYLKGYLEQEHDVIDKVMHRELLMDYTDYIRKKQDGNI